MKRSETGIVDNMIILISCTKLSLTCFLKFLIMLWHNPKTSLYLSYPIFTHIFLNNILYSNTLVPSTLHGSRRQSYDLWVLSVTTSKSDWNFQTLGPLGYRIQGQSQVYEFLVLSSTTFKVRLPSSSEYRNSFLGERRWQVFCRKSKGRLWSSLTWNDKCKDGC